MPNLTRGGGDMLTKEPTEVLDSLPEEVQQIVLALSILIARIGSLPPADRDDLFELLTAWRQASDKEEQRCIRRAMTEILTQGKVGVRREPLAAEHPLPRGVKGWAEHVGRKIRSLREKANLTQTQLAEKAGLPQSHISRLENAEHSATHLTLEKIAQALGVTAGDIDPCVD